MIKSLLKYLPFVLFVGYVAWNEYRLWDYKHVRQDAIIGVHYPEIAEKIRKGH